MAAEYITRWQFCNNNSTISVSSYSRCDQIVPNLQQLKRFERCREFYDTALHDDTDDESEMTSATLHTCSVLWAVACEDLSICLMAHTRSRHTNQ